MRRVALPKRDPETTSMCDVMTSSVTTVRNSIAPDDALKMMVERHIRHLPVVGASGKIDGILSIRHLLLEQVQNLEGELDSLTAYISADGIGG